MKDKQKGRKNPREIYFFLMKRRTKERKKKRTKERMRVGQK